MQTTDVQQLFDYLYWRRDRVLTNAAALPADGFVTSPHAASRDLRATLVHELDVEWSWRIRLQGAPAADWAEDQTLRPEAYPTVDALRAHWARDEAVMRAWIAGMSAEELAGPVTVNDLGGHALEAYLTHVVMHGIQSFSEAGVLLATAGHSVGDVDYLDSFDEREPGGT